MSAVSSLQHSRESSGALRRIYYGSWPLITTAQPILSILGKKKTFIEVFLSFNTKGYYCHLMCLFGAKQTNKQTKTNQLKYCYSVEILHFADRNSILIELFIFITTDDHKHDHAFNPVHSVALTSHPPRDLLSTVYFSTAEHIAANWFNELCDGEAQGWWDSVRERTLPVCCSLVTVWRRRAAEEDNFF